MPETIRKYTSSSSGEMGEDITENLRTIRALPLGLSTAVDVLVEGARKGRSDDQIRELLARLVPEFSVAAEATARVEVGPG